MCLKRDFHFEIANLFDTMVAARICGIRQVGLNNLVRAFLDIELDKSHQRDNWGRRPLSVASLRYAQMDTHYLLELRDTLAAQLETDGHLEEARETFDDLSRMTPAHEGRSFDPEGFWRIGLPARLTSQQMATLRALYLMRESLAERANMPPLNVVQNRTLLELALRQPCNREELKGIPGLSPNGIRRWGDAWLRAIRTSHPDLNAAPPTSEPPLPVDIQDRYTALHAWRKKRAEQRGVESDVIMTKQALWSLAYKDPASIEDLINIDGLGPWRMQAYGTEILAVLQHFENEA
jgi:ribonuclease D